MPTLTIGDAFTNMVVTAKQYIRVNAAGTDFESYTTVSDSELAAAIAAVPGLSYSQSAVSRSLNTNFQPSTTKNCIVSYSVDISCSMSLTGGQSGSVFLEISANGSTGWTTLSQGTNSNSGTLTIGLALTQVGTASVSGTIPSGYYVRLRTANNTSTPTFTYKSGQETTL